MKKLRFTDSQILAILKQAETITKPWSSLSVLKLIQHQFHIVG